MRKYNKSGKDVFEKYDRRLDKKRKKYGKKINALDGIEPYQVEVRNDDVMKAYRVLERRKDHPVNDKYDPPFPFLEKLLF